MADPVPPKEWSVEPVFDSSVYLDRPAVEYEDDMEPDGAAPPAEGESLGDED